MVITALNAFQDTKKSHMDLGSLDYFYNTRVHASSAMGTTIDQTSFTFTPHGLMFKSGTPFFYSDDVGHTCPGTDWCPLAAAHGIIAGI